MIEKQGEGLSSEMLELLKEEALEAEILAAIDAAAEEGILITRDEAISYLIQETKQNTEDNAQ